MDNFSYFYTWTFDSVVKAWNLVQTYMDPRTENYFLMESPLIPATISCFYMSAILLLTPWTTHLDQEKNHMSNKLSSAQKLVIKSYNLFIVLLNLLLAVLLSWIVFTEKTQFFCYSDEKTTKINSIISVRDLISSFIQHVKTVFRLFITVIFTTAPNLIYLFHISKIIELADTGFIIYRRKFSHLTFLHVYHHGTIVFATWIGVRFVPGGPTAIYAMINCWVHVIMYLYYFLTLFKKHNGFIKSYKKLITAMQIIQFIGTIFISGMTMYKDCGFPPLISNLLIFYMFTFLLLFVQFYIKTYK